MNIKIATALLLLIPVVAGCTPVPNPIKRWKGATEQALERQWTHYNLTGWSDGIKVVTYTAYFERLPSGLPQPYTVRFRDGRKAFHRPPKELMHKDWITCKIVFEIEDGIVTDASATGEACRYVQHTPAGDD